MNVIARLLRGLRALCASMRSVALLNWYRCLYPNATFGRGTRIGRGVHVSVVQGGALVVGDNVSIERDCQLIVEGSLSIGPNSFIGTGSIIVAAKRVAIGRDALIAAYATIRDQDHRLEGKMPYNRQGLVTAPVHIGDNVWIGTKASVLSGVTVGNDAVVGAHALVIRDVDALTIVGGVPAKFLKSLDPGNQLESD